MDAAQGLDLKKYAQLVYKRRHLFIIITALVTTAFVLYSYLMPKRYEASSTVIIERKFLNTVMKEITVTTSIDDQVQALATIMKSRPLILKVLNDLHVDLSKKSEAKAEAIVKEFQKSTEIKFDIRRSNRKDMDVFVVSMTNKDPVFARDYVNALIQRYIGDTLLAKKGEAQGANKFILEQIDLFKEKINVVDSKIAGMSQQKNIASPDRLSALQKRLNELLLQYTENHPEVIKVKDEIEAVKSRLKRQDSRSVPGPRDQNRQIDLQNEDVQPLRKGDEQKIKELERERETYRKIYEEMLATLGRAEVSSHIDVEDKGGIFNVLEPAVIPLKPMGPDRIKIILIGVVFGIVAGIGSIIFLDSVDKSVKTVDTLKDLGFPVLAVIPHMTVPLEIEKKRKKDVVLYIFTGLYYACIATVLAFEMFS